MERGERQRWHGFSGEGGGSSKPDQQGECGQLRNTFHRNARQEKIERTFSAASVGNSLR
ncbi:hypothetical protein AB28_2058 [Raoultella ornithinolytica 2-156-04_S1_C2]|nr:hypothetical protein AB00_1867 [Raoultella ornithinolytica 2-156-04_S1_C1]KDX13955.1 hypothetical protein AB28_2058 [Raoultella ornithinolytica 2-156-04_S1_C2]